MFQRVCFHCASKSLVLKDSNIFPNAPCKYQLWAPCNRIHIIFKFASLKKFKDKKKLRKSLNSKQSLKQISQFLCTGRYSTEFCGLNVNFHSTVHSNSSVFMKIIKGEKEFLQVNIQYSFSSPFMSVCWERLYLKHTQEKLKFKVSKLN